MVTWFRYYAGQNKINYSVRVLLALIGVVLPCWFSCYYSYIIPLVLGVIATALAETDGSLKLKAKSLGFTLVCFFIVAVTTQYLLAYPVLFAIGLFSYSFIFMFLSVLGTRFASITFASILLSIYTMLGYSSEISFWLQPQLLLAGAMWYGTISLLWQWLWPLYPVGQNLAKLYLELGEYFKLKAQLFKPQQNGDLSMQRYQLSQYNAKVVKLFNQCKVSLIAHAADSNDDYLKLLKIFFIAQDIHERVTASHYSYKELASTFAQDAILYKIAAIIEEQGDACSKLAHSLEHYQEYNLAPKLSWRLTEAEKSLEILAICEPNQALLVQLALVIENLSLINQDFSQLTALDTYQLQRDINLKNDEPQSFIEMWQLLKNEWRLDSIILRHSLRLAIGLVVGYISIQVFSLEMGYWILLTILFVCRANYSSTRKLFTQRILGTILGLLSGSLLLTLFPDLQSQLVLMIVSGVLFFIYRSSNYTFATITITWLVLFCFNQDGHGLEVVIPRLADTLYGCSIAAFLVTFFLPDWQSGRLNKLMRKSTRANRKYLTQIIAQYRYGKDDNLDYRMARRYAHIRDAKLVTALTDMLIEPEKYRINKERCFRFMELNHIVLNYISTLGAHRANLVTEKLNTQLNEIYLRIDNKLKRLERALSNNLFDLEYKKVNKDHNKHVIPQLNQGYTMLDQLKILEQIINEIEMEFSEIAK